MSDASIAEARAIVGPLAEAEASIAVAPGATPTQDVNCALISNTATLAALQALLEEYPVKAAEVAEIQT